MFLMVLVLVTFLCLPVFRLFEATSVCLSVSLCLSKLSTRTEFWDIRATSTRLY